MVTVPGLRGCWYCRRSFEVRAFSGRSCGLGQGTLLPVEPRRLASLWSRALASAKGIPVAVEVHLGNGLPQFQNVGLCAEFPSMSWTAGTPEQALKGIRKAVTGVVADMVANGEEIPVPLADRHYSGEFRVRIPRDLQEWPRVRQDCLVFRLRGKTQQ